MLRFQVFRWTIYAGMQEGLLRQFNGTCHTNEKNPKHWIFKPESLHMDISVSEIPFQLKIGIAVSGFYAVHFTSTGINHLWHEFMILSAICLILWANKDASGFFDPANKHWKFSFNCWLVGDCLDQMQLFYAHISLVVMPGRPTFVFTLPERRWYCITVLIKLHNLNITCCCSDQELLWARCFCLLLN